MRPDHIDRGLSTRRQMTGDMVRTMLLLYLKWNLTRNLTSLTKTQGLYKLPFTLQPLMSANRVHNPNPLFPMRSHLEDNVHEYSRTPRMIMRRLTIDS